MTFKLYILLFLIFVLNFDVLSQKKNMYDRCSPESIEMSINLNKKSYLPFEPILAEITFKNISERPQQFGSLNFFSLNIKYRVINGNNLLNRYYLWGETTSTGWFITSETSVQPKEVKEEKILLNHFLDFKTYLGKYDFSVGFPIFGKLDNGTVGITDYKTIQKKIEIIQPIDKDSLGLNLYTSTFNKIMDGLNFSKNELETDSAIVIFNYIIKQYPSSYLVEPSHFYKGFYFLQKYSLTNDKADIKKAKELLINFKGSYPESAYDHLIIEYLKTCSSILDRSN